jgi:hypothetical protein
MTPRRFVFARFTSTLPAVLVVLLAFAVRVFDLSAQSLWYDEGYTVMFAQRGINEIITGAAQLELNTPLHYLLLKFWMALAGTSEFSARLVSVFAGVITVVLTFPIARCVTGRASAVPALLVAFSPVCVMTAREVRMYALASCLCVASVVLLVICLARQEKGRREPWAAWAIVSLAAFAAHVLAAFVIGAQVLVLLIRLARGWPLRRDMAVAVSAVCVVMTVAAAVILFGGDSYGTTYRGQLDVLDIWAQSMAAQVLPRLLPEALVLPAAVLVLALLAFVLVRQRPLGYALWLITLFSIAGIAIFSVVTGKFSSRYPALVAPLFATCVGLALAHLQVQSSVARRISVVAVSVLALASAFGLAQLRTNTAYANEDFRGAVAHLRANLQPDERVVLVSGHLAPVFAYYFGPDGWTALPDDPVLNVNNTLTYTSTVPALNNALAGQGGAWLLTWQDDVIDPTGLATALLRRQSQAFGPQPDVPQFNGLGLKHYRFFQPFQALPEELPATQSRIEANRANRGLAGMGCVVPRSPRSGDAWMEAQCFWQSQPFAPLSVFTKVSLRLIGPDGAQVTQADLPITERGYPFTHYEKPMTGVYFIPLPEGLVPGAYTLRAIPYTETEEISPQVDTPFEVLP